MEQARTVIARYFLITILATLYSCTCIPVYVPMYSVTPPRAGLPPPVPYIILCVCTCRYPNNATSTCMKIVWLLRNNCSMNVLNYRDTISRYFTHIAISAKDHIAAALISNILHCEESKSYVYVSLQSAFLRSIVL